MGIRYQGPKCWAICKGIKGRFKVLATALFACIIFSTFGNVALTQAPPPITAEVDRTILSINERLVLTVKVAGDFLDIPTPDLSQITDFVVVTSSTSTQVSIINGNLTTQGVFVYELQPLKEGGLTIGPISINIAGQIYQTTPIDIRVVSNSATAIPTPSGNAPTALADQEFFVEAEVDNPTPYLGQQIIYIFKFYKAKTVTFIIQPNYQPPSFTNFWSQTVLSQPTYNTTTDDGHEYIVTEVRTALFPANLGPATIDSARMVIPNFPYQDIVLQTEPVSINTQSLPDGAPADFKGAVGRFEIGASLNEVEGAVNEPLMLIIEIKGTGNIKALTEPSLPKLPNWRIFESQTQDTIDVQGNSVYGARRFERLIVPGQPGDYIIPAISFSYFDIEANQYRTINTEPILITVHPGKDETPSLPPVNNTTPVKQPVSVLAGDIRHIKPAPMELVDQEVPLISSSLYWIAWIFPILVVSGVWIWQNRRLHLQVNTAYARSLRARRVAQNILAKAHRSGVDSYAAAHHALLGYLSDKLNRPTTGLTNNTLIGMLEEAGLDAALIEQVEATLTMIDIGRFAPGSEAAVESFIAETYKLINSLENVFKKLENKS